MEEAFYDKTEVFNALKIVVLTSGIDDKSLL